MIERGLWALALLAAAVQGQAATPASAVSSLCRQMSGMPGCSVQETCAKDSASFPSPFCSTESIYADICVSDMPSMGDCRGFNQTCQSPNCKALPRLPTSRQATQAIYSICSEMNMDGCDKCKIASSTSGYANCNLLEVYGQLCKAMPEMTQCKDWAAMCSATSSLAICSTDSASDPPTMKMYFHTGIRDYVLFQRAVPESTGDYVLALFLVFFFATLYEGYQVIYVRAIDWADNLSTAKTADSPTPSLSNKALAALIRASARIIGAGWSYLLMLITMTFNVGLFMAVVVGLGAGSAIFGPFHSKYSSLRVAEIQSSELCC